MQKYTIDNVRITGVSECRKLYKVYKRSHKMMTKSSKRKILNISPRALFSVHETKVYFTLLSILKYFNFSNKQLIISSFLGHIQNTIGGHELTRCTSVHLKLHC